MLVGQANHGCCDGRVALRSHACCAAPEQAGTPLLSTALASHAPRVVVTCHLTALARGIAPSGADSPAALAAPAVAGPAPPSAAALRPIVLLL